MAVKKKIETIVEEKVIKETKTAKVNVDKLNFRKAPNAKADVIYILNRDDNLTVVEEKGEWTKVKSGNKTGFVMSEFII